MNSKKRIVVIENQYTQFKKIRDYLSEYYDVYPRKDLEEFKEFIDLVRVFLNPRYGNLEEDSIREKAFGKLLKFITENIHPEIIIIDYILVGCHEAKNGIFLAKKFRENGIFVPFIFLSREWLDNYNVIEKYNKISEPKKWIEKGFAGKDILDEDYFTKHVLPQINSIMINDSIYLDELKSSVYNIIESNAFDQDEWKNEVFKELNNIYIAKNINEINQEKIDAINTYLSSYKRRDDRINFKNNLINYGEK